MSTTLTPNGKPKFYGRRKGKRLRAGRQNLVDTLLPEIRVPIVADGTTLDPRTLYAAPMDALWLEIGFGGGEHLVAQARANPTVGIIGAEPFIDGVAKALSAIDDQGLDNIRLLDDDVRLILPTLPDGVFQRIFVLFADPWPKARHHERRFIRPDNLDQLTRLLADGGELRFASDHAGYVRWALFYLTRHADLEWTAECASDWAHRPDDWIETRYEAKALAKGDPCAYLNFRRRNRS